MGLLALGWLYAREETCPLRGASDFSLDAHEIAWVEPLHWHGLTVISEQLSLSQGVPSWPFSPKDSDVQFWTPQLPGPRLARITMAAA